MTFVDNMFTPANSWLEGITAMRKFEADLLTRWHLNFGADSKRGLHARYNKDPRTKEQEQELLALQEEYPSVDCSKQLGCFVDNSGSLHPDFDDLEAKLWKAFFSIAGSYRGRQSSEQSRIRLADRSCRSIVAHRVSRWPWQPILADRLDRIQTAMIADIQWRPRAPQQTPAQHKMERGE